jgi:hypothetical protein
VVKSTKRLSGLLLALAMPEAASAAPGWSAPLTINSLLPTDQHLTLIVTGNDNPLGCSSSSWLRLHPGDANFSLISSGILTAFAQGKTIKVWESNCETDGTVHFIAAWIDR